MLSPLLRNTAALLAAATIFSASAETPPPPPEPDYEALFDRAAQIVDGVRSDRGENFENNPEVLKQVEAIGGEFMEDREATLAEVRAMGLSGRGDPTNPQLISDETMASNRAKIMDFLGLDEARDQLYVFVSFSMPEDMIRAYLREAMWAGATLIVRGTPPGMDLIEFITEYVKPLIGNKGAAATIQIDPTLFDLYDITGVPTIVLTEDLKRAQCRNTNTITRLDHIGEERSFPGCAPAADDVFLKVSGAITLDYALEMFKKEGSEAATRRLTAMRSHLGMNPMQTQSKLSKAELDSQMTPSARAALQRTLRSAPNVPEMSFQVPEGVRAPTDKESPRR